MGDDEGGADEAHWFSGPHPVLALIERPFCHGAVGLGREQDLGLGRVEAIADSADVVEVRARVRGLDAVAGEAIGTCWVPEPSAEIAPRQ